MNKRINPNLLKLAELTHNPELKVDKTILEKKVDIKPSDAPNLDGYIYVPPINLYVAKEKTLHGKGWYHAHKELHKQKLQMLTIPEFIEFIKYLKQNPNQENTEVLDEILTARAPWRAEWLDADFKFINEKLHINYNHRTINGELKPGKSEPLEDCLMEDKFPGINLDYWLKNPTKQGMPRKNTTDGKLWYWHPIRDNNSIAKFGSGYSGHYLTFDKIPQYSNSWIGVRAAKTRELK